LTTIERITINKVSIAVIKVGEKVIIREYIKQDREMVLDLFRLNAPKYFAPEEETDLAFYLDHEIEFYFVLELDKVIVGCGGFNFSEDKTNGIISWDILHPDFQGRSLGRNLLNYRIERLKKFPQVQQITVRTSQLAYKFYEKLGFKIIEVVENYWAKGFHLYKMVYAN
jgi:[ribosomal protein S18]-alanine N-acetyltransferase